MKSLDPRWRRVVRFHRFTKHCQRHDSEHLQALIESTRSRLGCEREQCGEALSQATLYKHVIDARCTCDGQTEQFVEDLQRAGWGVAQSDGATLLPADTLHAKLKVLGPFDTSLLFLHEVESLSAAVCADIYDLDERYVCSHIRCTRLNLMGAICEHQGKRCVDEHCLYTLQRLSDFWDGRCAGAIRKRIQHHLKQCDACYDFSGRMGKHIEMIGGLDAAH